MTEQEFLEQIKANKGTIHSVCNTYCAGYSRNDLVQEILLETWKSLGKWKNNCKFSTWLYTIAHNVCVRTLQKENRRPVMEGLEEYVDVLSEVDNTPELLKQLHEAKRYNSVLNSLEEPYRTLFHMYTYGASFKELEKHSGVNENTLRVKIHRIKKQLRLRYGSQIIK